MALKLLHSEEVAWVGWRCELAWLQCLLPVSWPSQGRVQTSGGMRVLLYHFHYLLMGPEQGTLKVGFTLGVMAGNSSNGGISRIHVGSSFDGMDLLYTVTRCGRPKPPLDFGRNRWYVGVG